MNLQLFLHDKDSCQYIIQLSSDGFEEHVPMKYRHLHRRIESMNLHNSFVEHYACDSKPKRALNSLQQISYVYVYIYIHIDIDISGPCISSGSQTWQWTITWI